MPYYTENVPELIIVMGILMCKELWDDFDCILTARPKLNIILCGNVLYADSHFLQTVITHTVTHRQCEEFKLSCKSKVMFLYSLIQSLFVFLNSDSFFATCDI